MSRITRRPLIAVSVVALVAINIVAMRWSSAFFHAPQSRPLLKYGAHMPRLKGQSLSGNKPIELSTDRTNLVLYFSSKHQPGLSIELVKYAEILSQRYGKDGLRVSAIVPPDVDELGTLIAHSLLSYEVIADQKRQIGEALGLASNQNGVFVFDREGLCRFATRRPLSADDLRQLVAMEFLHVDPFANPGAASRVIQHGKQLGEWPIVDVRSWERTSLKKISSGAPSQFIFFTAECSVCSLPAYLDEFEKLERGRPGKTSLLVFDYNFSGTDVLKQLQEHNINSAAYVVTEPLPAVEEMYEGEAPKDETVVVVQTDTRALVLDISPLKSLVAERKSSAVMATKPQVMPTPSIRYEEVFNNVPLSAYDAASFHGKYVLTDFKGNRVFIVGDNMQIETEFGRIGSGPGRLVHPGTLDVASDGTIYVEDGGNERIVKFSMEGQYLGELPLTQYEGFAVGPQNEIYLGQPEAGHLITTYSGSGKKLRSFGQLKKFSEIYGPAFADKDEPYKIAFNRVRLATDKDGNLYVSFMLTPLLQKYSPAGELLFESKLESPEVDRLVTAIQKRKYIGTMSDGADARIIALDPVIEPTTGNIFVPLIDGSIYLADRDGKRLTVLRPQAMHRSDDTFYPFAAGLGAKGELLVSPFPLKRWYRLVMPSDSVGNAGPSAESKSSVGGR